MSASETEPAPPLIYTRQQKNGTWCYLPTYIEDEEMFLICCVDLRPVPLKLGLAFARREFTARDILAALKVGERVKFDDLSKRVFTKTQVILFIPLEILQH